MEFFIMLWKTTPCDAPLTHVYLINDQTPAIVPSPLIPHPPLNRETFPLASCIYIYNIHLSKTTIAFRLSRIVNSKKVPKGYFAVYVGENQK
ncbi:hypothetical protein Godav_029303, partial [Gossypium davidsonii]|nr:hypothetical protein [Gossypium davidsonii]